MSLDIANIFPSSFSGILSKSWTVFKRTFLQLFFISAIIHSVTYLIFAVIFNEQNPVLNLLTIDILRYLAGQALNVVCLFTIPIFLLNIKKNALFFLLGKDILIGVLFIIIIQLAIKIFSTLAPGYYSMVIFFVHTLLFLLRCSIFLILEILDVAL